MDTRVTERATPFATAESHAPESTAATGRPRWLTTSTMDTMGAAEDKEAKTTNTTTITTGVSSTSNRYTTLFLPFYLSCFIVFH